VRASTLATNHARRRLVRSRPAARLRTKHERFQSTRARSPRKVYPTCLCLTPCVRATLHAVHDACLVADGANRCVQLIDEAGGVEKLEALQMHENSVVFTKTACLLDAYFSDDAAADDPSIAPTSHADSFAFGVPAAPPQPPGPQQPPPAQVVQQTIQLQ
jgi:hypothetical protein